jgi:hypothetical protein
MFVRIAAIICAVALPTTTFADYGIGFSLGRNYVVVGDEKDADRSFKIYADYSIYPSLGLGLAYHDLGRTEFCTGCADAGGYFDTSVISLSMRGNWSVDRVRLSAWVGYAYWYQDGEKETLEGPRLIAERANDVTYGLGGDVGVAGGFCVRAEWEVFDLASNYSADMFSVGLCLKLR